MLKANKQIAAGPYVRDTRPRSLHGEKFPTLETIWQSCSQSQAIATPSTIYCSGQIPCTPSGEILSKPSSSIADMTELCIKNLTAVLKEAGSSIEKVVKVNVFLTTMDSFAEMVSYCFNNFAFTQAALMQNTDENKWTEHALYTRLLLTLMHNRTVFTRSTLSISQPEVVWQSTNYRRVSMWRLSALLWPKMGIYNINIHSGHSSFCPAMVLIESCSGVSAHTPAYANLKVPLPTATVLKLLAQPLLLLWAKSSCPSSVLLQHASAYLFSPLPVKNTFLHVQTPCFQDEHFWRPPVSEWCLCWAAFMSVF